jgi:hypothetical protein
MYNLPNTHPNAAGSTLIWLFYFGDAQFALAGVAFHSPQGQLKNH